MRAGRLILLFFSAWLGLSAVARAADVNYMSPVIGGVPTNVIVINLNSHHYVVRPVMARTTHQHGRSDTFLGMVRGTHALAAINGTFFDCRTLKTLGSMVSNGHMVYEGYVGNAIAVDEANSPCFVKCNRENGHHVDWSPYRFAICSGPTLVYHDKIALNPWAEGFHDPHVFGDASRSAIGVRRDHRLMLVTVHRHVSLSRLAHIMRSLGAEYALNLDGGSSSALYFRGRLITRPNRRLTNILTICPLDMAGRHGMPLDSPSDGPEMGHRTTRARTVALRHGHKAL